MQRLEEAFLKEKKEEEEEEENKENDANIGFQNDKKKEVGSSMSKLMRILLTKSRPLRSSGK